MSKKIDLTGQRFGKLLVLEEAERPANIKKKHIFWKCQCDCGNIYICDGTNLRSGRTTQCLECAHKASGKKRRKDVIGQTFGLLTVDSVDYGVIKDNGRQRTYCNCTCACGNKTYTSLDDLLSPGLHSCGCGRKITADALSRDIIGQKFNRLTVIEEYKECTPREVLCECECGNKVRLIKTEVMSGGTKSCGCLKSEVTSKINTKDWAGYKNDYGVELIEQDYKNDAGTWMWKCRCPFCGSIFTCLPADVASNKRASCGCLVKSKNEELIESILKENNVFYIPQYRIDDCRDINTLPFDFGIFTDFETLKLIEYDGKQHYESIEWFGGDEAFQTRKKHDEIKTQYCLDNNIELIRIPYTYTPEKIRETIMSII